VFVSRRDILDANFELTVTLNFVHDAELDKVAHNSLGRYFHPSVVESFVLTGSFLFWLAASFLLCGHSVCKILYAQHDTQLIMQNTHRADL